MGNTTNIPIMFKDAFLLPLFPGVKMLFSYFEVEHKYFDHFYDSYYTYILIFYDW